MCYFTVNNNDTQREDRHAPKSPSQEVGGWGLGLGCGWPHVTPVQPARLSLGKLNTHRQPGHCTQCCLGEERLREGAEEWPTIVPQGRTLSTLHWEF